MNNFCIHFFVLFRKYGRPNTWILLYMNKKEKINFNHLSHYHYPLNHHHFPQCHDTPSGKKYHLLVQGT